MSQQDCPAQPVIFKDKAGRFQVVLSRNLLSAMRSSCAESAGLETGGILIGHYSGNHHTAVITHWVGPPPDSKKGRATFYRGTAGLGNLLERIWPKQEYYLGEWHYHPSGAPKPSPQDRQQMQNISEDPTAQCPEPLLVIVNSNGNLSVYVFRRHQKPVSLTPSCENRINGDTHD